MIFVNEVVAMEHVQSGPWGKVGDNIDLLVSSQVDHVLERGSFVRSNPLTARSRAGNNLHVNEMNMNWVTPS